MILCHLVSSDVTTWDFNGPWCWSWQSKTNSTLLTKWWNEAWLMISIMDYAMRKMNLYPTYFGMQNLWCDVEQPHSVAENPKQVLRCIDEISWTRAQELKCTEWHLGQVDLLSMHWLHIWSSAHRMGSCSFSRILCRLPWGLLPKWSFISEPVHKLFWSIKSIFSKIKKNSKETTTFLPYYHKKGKNSSSSNIKLRTKGKQKNIQSCKLQTWRMET